MNWSRLLIFALVTTGLTGSIAYIIVKGINSLLHIKNPYFMISLIKVVLFLYSVPVLLVAVLVDRTVLLYSINGWEIATLGVFLTDRLYVVNQIGILTVLIWIAGCGMKLAYLVKMKRILNGILQENKIIHDEYWTRIIEEYQIKFQISKLELYENDNIPSPISIKKNGYVIVVPKRKYSEKECRMILEHECNHIQQNDLMWRKIATIVEVTNWYNPLINNLFQDLVYYQEVRCDLKSIYHNCFFTPKEYGCFLIGLSDVELSQMRLTALCESKSMLTRRLKMMTEVKQMKKVSKKVIIAIGMGVTIASIFPVNIVSAHMINMEEKIIYASEKAVEEVPLNWEMALKEKVEYAGDNVNEISVIDDLTGLSDMVVINNDMSANTRYLFGTKKMVSGNSIVISTTCETGNTYRIGIKNQTTGKLTYVEGSGTLTHEFKITEEGNYSAYVENKSGESIHVNGYIDYQY